MLTPSSRPRLPSSLQRRAGGLWDGAMRRGVALNEVGAYVVDRMDGTRSISRIAAEVSAGFGVSGDVALSDTLTFTEKLRGYGIVDAGTPVGDTLRALVLSLLAPGRPVPPLVPQRRVDVRGGALPRILAGVLPLVFRKLLPVAALLAIVLGWAILALTGDIRDAGLFAAGASLALPLGVGLHEGAHLYAVRRSTGDPNLGYIKARAFQISITYPNLRPEKNFWIALCGPLCPIACGVALYCLNLVYVDPLVVAAALVLVAHTISYVPVPGSDGMNLLSYAVGVPAFEGPGGPLDPRSQRTIKKEQR